MRRWLGLVVLVLFGVVAVFGLAESNQRRSGPALDPRSTAPDGARAAAVLLEQRGVDIDLGGLPSPDRGGSLVVLVDDLEPESWEGIEQFVAQGGDLVLAAPFAPLAPRVLRTTTAPASFEDDCQVLSLAAVADLDVPVVRSFEGDGPTCLETPDGPVAVVTPHGRGRILALGTAHPWRNDALADADHAAFVVGAAQWAAEPVRLLERGAVGTGGETLFELVPPWIWATLAQLGLAVVLYSIWRAIRLGPVVAEEDEVQYPATSLLLAIAGRTAERGDDAWAAAQLERYWREDLRSILGWSGDDPRQAVSEAGLVGTDAEQLLASLDPDTPPLERAAAIRATRVILTQQDSFPTRSFEETSR